MNALVASLDTPLTCAVTTVLTSVLAPHHQPQGVGHVSAGAGKSDLPSDTDHNKIVMNAAATTSITTRVDRSQPRGADPDGGSGAEFEQLWAALRDAPARAAVQRAEPSTAPVMVSAAAMSKAAVKINPDRVVDALTAFKRDSWFTFTNAVAASQYAADLAPRGAPAARGLGSECPASEFR